MIDQKSVREFEFDAGVKREARGNHPLPNGARYSPNGVLVFPFWCADVPEGAALDHLSDYPESGEGLLMRETLPGSGLLSRFAFFKPPVTEEVPHE
jgi:hypothetical protein